MYSPFSHMYDLRSRAGIVLGWSQPDIPDHLSPAAIERVKLVMDDIAKASGFSHLASPREQSTFLARADALLGRQTRRGLVGFARFQQIYDEPSRVIIVTHSPDAHRTDQIVVRAADLYSRFVAYRAPLDQLLAGRGESASIRHFLGSFSRKKILKAIPERPQEETKETRHFRLPGVARLWGPR